MNEQTTDRPVEGLSDLERRASRLITTTPTNHSAVRVDWFHDTVLDQLLSRVRNGDG